MRTYQEVIGLARLNGARTLEIKFVDELGSARQFTCRVEPHDICPENARGRAVFAIGADTPDRQDVEFIQRLRHHGPAAFAAFPGRGAPAADTLSLGGSDFVAGPVAIEALAARTRAALTGAPVSAADVFRSGSLAVDLARRLVTVAGRVVKLSATEYALLQLLVKHAGAVVSYSQMLQEVWGGGRENKLNYLRVYLAALRKKLETPTEPSLLLNERSVGYRLVIR
jgi:two-component system KDP operon response regulator KdpE